MTPNFYFSDVSEHDMDLLIMEEFICDEGFRNIFLKKINIDKCTIEKAYHSLSDSNGESDLTFVVNVNGSKCGILIEDKIDAITMDKQSERYYIRGNDGKKRGEYEKFYVFLVCPEEYWQEHQDDKNAKFEYIVFYEELRDYLLIKKDIRSHYKLEIVKQALDAKKKGYQLVENDDVTSFWRNLQQFCEEKFPSLYLNYDGKAKGSSSSWFYFRTPFKKNWVIYKANSGDVWLELNGFDTLAIESQIKLYLEEDMEFYKVGKSFGVLLHKERWKTSVEENFDNVKHIIHEILEQIVRLVELVKKLKLLK